MFRFLPLELDEIQLLSLILLAISTALLGSFLVQRKMSMLANSLSHTILLGIVLAYLAFLPMQAFSVSIPLHILFIAALITAFLTTFLTMLLTRVAKLQEDASIAIVFTSLFALGVVIVTIYAKNAHIGLEAIMGNIDALHLHDLNLLGLIAVINLIAILIFYKELFISSFDPSHAKMVGISNFSMHFILMALVAATAIGAFRALGVLLFLAFLVGPVLTARLITDRFNHIILVAMGIGIFSSCISVALSRHIFSVYHLPLSTAGITVVLIGLCYPLALLKNKLIPKIA